MTATEQRAAGPKASKKRAAKLSAHPDPVVVAAAVDAEQSAAERRKSKPRKPRLSPPLPSYLRFADLVAANIVTSWMNVNRLVDRENFPPGVLFGANTRAWRRDEIENWLRARPTAKKFVPGRRKPEPETEGSDV